MNQGTSYECAGCEVGHWAPTAALPQGWSMVDGKPICGDCLPNDPPIPPIGNPRSETSIRLLSGAYLDLADPDCSVIRPIDIAAGLRAPRFCGQTRQFYTIAQHCLLVLKLVSPIARSLAGEKSLQLRRCALMHDAAEAFLHDITPPLKIQLPDYRAIEARFELRMAAAFDWQWTPYRRDTIKAADLQALAIEQRDLVGTTDDWPILRTVNRDRLAGVRIRRAWQPDEAQDRFLSAFEDLFSSDERLAA